MRLICPGCSALYDVPDEMIPPEGREVECSACGHVWHQSADPREMRGLAADLRRKQPPPDTTPPPDLGPAPELRQPLPADVLAILREETARELEARRSARKAAGRGAGKGDASAPAAESSPEPAESQSQSAPVAEQVEEAAEQPPEVADTAPPPREDAPAPPAETPPRPQIFDELPPVQTITTPGSEAPIPQAAAPAVGVVDPSAQERGEARPAEDAEAPDHEMDWPATTLTAPDDSQPRLLALRKAIGVGRPEAAPPAGQQDIPPQGQPDAQPQGQPAPQPPAGAASASAAGPHISAADPTPAPTPAAARPNTPPRTTAPPSPPIPSRRIAKTLPDVAQLAATLHTEAAAPEPGLPATVAPPAPRGGYGAGLRVGLGVAGGVLLLYLLGLAWDRSGNAPEGVAALLHGVDQSRATLHDAAFALVGQGTD